MTPWMKRRIERSRRRCNKVRNESERKSRREKAEIDNGREARATDAEPRPNIQ